MVREFRTRPLETEYPVLWIDALYEKIRDQGRSQNKAIMVVKGINLQGMPQILAVEPFAEESEENYRLLFASLKDRGLKKVWLCVSDAHRGLQNAIQKEFLGASWQRCKVQITSIFFRTFGDSSGSRLLRAEYLVTNQPS